MAQVETLRLEMTELTMAQSSDQFPFFQVPYEIRTMIFKMFFQSLSVRAHNKYQERCKGHTSQNKISYSNMMLVSKQFHSEAKLHFLPLAIFCVTPECWKPVDRLSLRQILNVRNIVFTVKLRDGSHGMIEEPEYIISQLYDLVCLTETCVAPIQNIFYNWRFLTTEKGCICKPRVHTQKVKD